MKNILITLFSLFITVNAFAQCDGTVVLKDEDVFNNMLTYSGTVELKTNKEGKLLVIEMVNDNTKKWIDFIANVVGPEGKVLGREVDMRIIKFAFVDETVLTLHNSKRLSAVEKTAFEVDFKRVPVADLEKKNKKIYAKLRSVDINAIQIITKEGELVISLSDIEKKMLKELFGCIEG